MIKIGNSTSMYWYDHLIHIPLIGQEGSSSFFLTELLMQEPNPKKHVFDVSLLLNRGAESLA